MTFRRNLILGAGLSFALGCLAPQAMGQAPRPTDPPKPAPTTPAPAGQPPATPVKPPAPPDPKKLRNYEDVVTKEAKTEKGVFTVHRIDERILFEIPANLIGRDILWQVEAAQVPTGTGFGGAHLKNAVVRFTRRENKIYLRLMNFDLRAEKGEAIQRAVRDATIAPIIAVFDVQTESKEKSPVIDATRLYFSPPTELAGSLGAGADPSRSYIERVKAFPNNIEARIVATSGGFRGTGTYTIHYSLNLLPEKPMTGRLADSRVGYFTEEFQDVGRSDNRVADLAYIARYRLEKKDPSAALSEPVKPIVYYVSREVPDEFKEYVRKGVEDWQPAFEAAGFKNAIICKLAPTEKEDPNWDPEDSRYSVIRWAPNPIANAMGPHVHDPRSGEIISAHIIVWHDILKLNEQWYFSQVGPLDLRAQKFPFPLELSGALLRYVVCHEVGHTLGLRHNHKASSTFTVAQLRNKAFTEKWGDEASIMDYGRFNYVAQPGDNVRLIPKLGPYDLFAIEWGYKPIAGATTPDDEKPALNNIAIRQVTNPTVRFGSRENNGNVFLSDDPTIQIEDLSNDGLEAGRLGFLNLKRAANLLIPATSKYGEDYSRLSEMFDGLMQQYQMELIHAIAIIGGVVETDYHAGQGGDVFKTVPKARQQAAMRHLVEYGFERPKELIPLPVLKRITPTGAANILSRHQSTVLNILLSPARIQRLMDAQAINGSDAYSVSDMVGELQSGIWSELKQRRPVIDLFKRNLQRAYLQRAKVYFQPDTTNASELRAALLFGLQGLQKSIEATIPKTQDKETLLHLRDSRLAIDQLLNPRR